MTIEHRIDPLAQAERLRREGHDIMDRIGLLDRWGRIGRPMLVGSVRFGLMARPNLDLEIYTDRPDVQTGFAVIAEFAALPGVAQIQFVNALDTPDQGLYWRIDYVDERGTTWDIDNWLVAHDHPNAGLADRFASAMDRCLTDETRRRILEIKTNASEGPAVRGIDVYKAVLRDGVRTYEEFRQWETNQPTVVIEEWTPCP